MLNDLLTQTIKYGAKIVGSVRKLNLSIFCDLRNSYKYLKKNSCSSVRPQFPILIEVFPDVSSCM